MDIKEGMANFFGPKIKKKKQEEESKASGVPEWVLSMPEGAEKDKLVKKHKMITKGERRNEEKDKYNCGGVKYSKLKERMKKGKKD